MNRAIVTTLLLLLACSAQVQAKAASPNSAETVLIGGKVLTLDEDSRIVTAIAVGGGRVIAVGNDNEILKLADKETTVIRLGGKTVIPGIIAAHCHAIGVARNELQQPHEELLTIGEIQDWIRRRAKTIPPGQWIRTPRADITRLNERRHPTTSELDQACTTHPVIFTAARKSAMNTLGLRTAGVKLDSPSIPGGDLVLDDEGNVRLIAGANAHLRSLMPRPVFDHARVQESLRNVHQHYNSVGITSIFERAGSMDDFLRYRELRSRGLLTVRMTQTFRSGFRRAKDVAAFTKKVGLKTGDGDDWVRAGPLKITVDGGIHWGNTFLREDYGASRIKFYSHKDAKYRGDINYTVPQMAEVFAEGHRLGWQWCCHVTGDAGVDAILDSLEIVQQKHPNIVDRRFSFTHAYFPATDSIARASRLGVCLDTQPSLYFKDSDAIAEVYGADWAARFIGLGDWIRGGIPTAIAGDHMMGLDPNRSMNAYNPFLMLQVAVSRRNWKGKLYGPRQKLDRMQALRCITTAPAHLSFSENKAGSLEQGKFADLVVLDRDYLTCPENEIAKIKVVRTMVDGKFVFDARKAKITFNPPPQAKP